ncbi:MAG: DUF1848 family protein [Muribaculaceae bacterium]|nr:DUF1848 family protein [Muribaculaceae bacterium]MBQ5409154.1 DUF1848 family protein [Muribaculaceae bacterium]
MIYGILNLPHLAELKERGIGCYIQFTLNDYEKEDLEPNVPELVERIETFQQFVDQFGKGSVIWRFDPQYCYANTSPQSAAYNLERHNPHSETII